MSVREFNPNFSEVLKRVLAGEERGIPNLSEPY